MKRCGGIFDVAHKLTEIEGLEEQAASPTFWDDQNAARQNFAETNKLKLVTEPFKKLAAVLDDCDVLTELLEMEEDEAERAEGQTELRKSVDRMQKLFDDLELKSLLGGKMDGANCYLSINAGAGGTESCDWASMLFRMYQRFCERQEWECTVMDVLEGEEAGIKSATLYIQGPFAYGLLKAERGVHRLVRISPFDSASRRHTSFVALDIVAEIDEEIEVDLQESDLRVDTFRASGAGGQHVNTTDSAVRITHGPSGIVVQCQAERSQHRNRDKCMKMLQAKLYEWQLDQQRKEIEKFYDPKGAIAWGSQIRSYVLQPYTMVKDHRTSHEMGNAQGVLDGDLLGFVEAYLKHNRADEHTE